MRTVCYLLAAAFALAAPSVPANSGDASESGWQDLQVHDLPEPWREVFDAIRERPWVQAEFSETRVFPFRRSGVERSGILWFGREEGLTLNYRDPREETIRIDETGMRVIREEHDVRTSQIGGDDRTVPETLLALFRFDFSELRDVFEMRGRLDGDDWRLRLIPRQKDAPVEQIEIGGEESALTEIKIRQNKSRRIEIRLSNIEYPSVLDESERARRFP